MVLGLAHEPVMPGEFVALVRGRVVSAAIIGAVAVIVGAVFTGVASDIIERRKRRSAGRAAALAIAAELDLLASKLDSAAAPGDEQAADADATHELGWWVGVPPISAWRSSFDALAAVAPRELIRFVATAYGQAESWQAERGQAGDLPPNAAQVVQLKKDVELAERARDDLNLFATASGWRKALRWTPDEPGWRKAVRWTPALLAISAFAIFLAVPRDDINTQTVATAVEQAYGPMSVAECDQVVSHWSCSVFTLAFPRAVCLSGFMPRTVAASTAHPPCALSAPKRATVVDLGDQLLITPGDRERGRNRRAWTEPTTERSLLWKAWRVFRGLSPNG